MQRLSAILSQVCYYPAFFLRLPYLESCSYGMLRELSSPAIPGTLWQWRSQGQRLSGTKGPSLAPVTEGSLPGSPHPTDITPALPWQRGRVPRARSIKPFIPRAVTQEQPQLLPPGRDPAKEPLGFYPIIISPWPVSLFLPSLRLLPHLRVHPPRCDHSSHLPCCPKGRQFPAAAVSQCPFTGLGVPCLCALCHPKARQFISCPGLPPELNLYFNLHLNRSSACISTCSLRAQLPAPEVFLNNSTSASMCTRFTAGLLGKKINVAFKIIYSSLFKQPLTFINSACISVFFKEPCHSQSQLQPSCSTLLLEPSFTDSSQPITIQVSYVKMKATGVNNRC